MAINLTPKRLVMYLYKEYGYEVSIEDSKDILKRLDDEFCGR